MSAIVQVHRNIRRALEGKLHTAAIAAGLVGDDGKPLIEWVGIPFKRAGLTGFISCQVGMGDVIVHEIGPKPMVQGPGFVTCVIRTPLDKGADANDKLLGIITAAYPYASTATFGDVTVHIDKMQHRGYGSDEPWLTGLVSVDWNIYRRTP